MVQANNAMDSMPSLPISSADDSIPSISVNETFDDGACSMPSLSVNETFNDEACSMPSLPTSSVGVEDEATKSSSLSLQSSNKEDVNVNQTNNISGPDFVHHIELEMLQVAIDRTNLAGRDLIVGTTSQSSVPHLYTSQRPEQRENSIQSRLLRERDSKLLCPLELPVFKTDTEMFPAIKSKKAVAQKNSEKQVLQRSDQIMTASRGIQCSKKEEREANGYKPLKTNEKSVQVVVVKEEMSDDGQPDQKLEESTQTMNKPGVDDDTRPECKTSTDINSHNNDNVHPSSGKYAKIDEPLYKVMTVSAPRSKPKVVDHESKPLQTMPVMSSNHTIPEQFNGEKKSAYSSMFMKELETSQQNVQAKNENMRQNASRVFNNDANVTGIIGTSTSFAKAHDEGKREPSDTHLYSDKVLRQQSSYNKPVATLQRKAESADVLRKQQYGETRTQNNDVAPFMMTSRIESSSTNNHDIPYVAQRHQSNEISTQTNSIKPNKPTVANVATHTVQPSSTGSNKYEDKLCSLENELKGIRVLLEETKSKSKSSIVSRKGGRHMIPRSIAVPKVLPGKFAYESPSNRTSSTISTIPRSTGKSEAQLKCKTKLFQVESNRRRNTIEGGRNQFVSGTFSPSASFCGDDSVSFVEPRRRPSRRLLQPRPSILKVERINHEETES